MSETLSKKREINWPNVLFHLQINSLAIFTIGYIIRTGCLYKTIFFGVILIILGVLGQYAGSHRLWAHSSYKATKTLKVFLMLCQTLVGSGTIYNWVIKHRLHHKYFGTDLDPFNHKKGFFYPHLTSLMYDLSPAQKDAIKEIDVRDLKNDGIVMFQKKWYKLLYFLFVILLPINAPCEYWNEGIITSFMVIGWLKYAITLQICAFIHSAITIWDLKPNEKYPADTNLVFLITKTNWISYHYLAPWDYQTGEFGKYGNDFITKFIKICEVLEHVTKPITINSDNVRKALTKSSKDKKDIKECLAEFATFKDSTPFLIKATKHM